MAKFEIGDKVIWFKPVKMEVIEYDECDKTFNCRVVRDITNSSEGERWWFSSNGIWNNGELETHGVIVHPGATITSGPEPKRKPDYKFNDREFVLVRDKKNKPWKLAAFKGYNPEYEFPYDTYNNEVFKMCIPYAGNERKMGEVTED